MIETIVQAVQSLEVKNLPQSSLIIVFLVVIILGHQEATKSQYLLMEGPVLKV